LPVRRFGHIPPHNPGRNRSGHRDQGGLMSIWLLVLIIVLLVLLFGGFGYARR
jgi:hypothetical protein